MSEEDVRPTFEVETVAALSELADALEALIMSVDATGMADLTELQNARLSLDTAKTRIGALERPQ